VDPVVSFAGLLFCCYSFPGILCSLVSVAGVVGVCVDHSVGVLRCVGACYSGLSCLVVSRRCVCVGDVSG
jgi:hypothetical protein